MSAVSFSRAADMVVKQIEEYEPEGAVAQGKIRSATAPFLLVQYYSASNSASARVGSKVPCTVGTERVFRTYPFGSVRGV